MRRSALSMRLAVVSLVAMVVLPSARVEAEFAAAFLQTGLGVRGPGMGGAFSAAVADASASYWNAARLTRNNGLVLGATVHALSLDRAQTSLAVAQNTRGGLAFGLVWVHASTGSVTARTGAGESYGQIANGDNAVLFALGVPVTKRLALGGGFKILRSRIEVPQIDASTATGRGLDLYAHFSLNANTSLALSMRNLGARLSWTVQRSSQQANKTTNELSSGLTLGIAHELAGRVLLAADGFAGGVEKYMNAGAETKLNPLLTVRAGIARVGSADGVGSPAFGLTLRPMQIETVQFHYAYVSDDLGAGARTLAGLEVKF